MLLLLLLIINQVELGPPETHQQTISKQQSGWRVRNEAEEEAEAEAEASREGRREGERLFHRRIDAPSNNLSIIIHVSWLVSLLLLMMLLLLLLSLSL